MLEIINGHMLNVTSTNDNIKKNYNNTVSY